MGLLIFFRRTLKHAFQLRSKVHLAKYLSPTVFKSRYLWSFPQAALSGSHRDLKQKCCPFYFVTVDLFLHKFIIFESMHIFSTYNFHSKDPVVKLHANAKNHCLLFKSVTCCFHLVFLVFLLESLALSHYLLLILFSMSFMNTLRSKSLCRDS